VFEKLTSTNKMYVSMCADGIFHIKISDKTGKFTEPLLSRYSIINDEDNTDIYTANEDGVFCDSCSMILLSDDKKIKFTGSHTELTLSVSDTESGYGIGIDVLSTERFFGLGHYGSQPGIIRNGKKFTIWQENLTSYAPVPFLFSSAGWGILVNTTYKHTYDVVCSKNDRISIDVPKGTADFFVFIGDSMKEIITKYTDIAGKPMVLPSYAYGLTFVNNEEEGARDMLQNCLNFRREDIPCDVMGLEPNWMSKHYDYSLDKNWNDELFYIPYWKPEGYSGTWSFFYNLRKLGYKFTLWLCCDYDLFWHEERSHGNISENFEIEERSFAGANVMDVHFADSAVVMDKVTIPTEPWFEHLKKFTDNGASGFKLDGALQVMPHPDRLWAGKYTDDEIHNLYPVVYVKQMKEGFEEHTGKRALIYTPSVYVGTQKYAASWAGDVSGTTEYIMNMAFCGHSNTSCDLEVNDPLGLHFGFLMPWAQILSWRSWFHPWFLGDETEEMIRYYSKLRSSLFPYIYSMAHYAAKTGIAIIRPLSMMYEDRIDYDDVLNMYMFGDSLLVGAFDMHLTLPEGRWYDYFTGDIYDGNCTIDYQIPKGRGGALLVKEGSVFVTQAPKPHIDKDIPGNYTINIFPGKDCSFRWIEDDGITYGYEKDEYTVTDINVTDSDDSSFILRISPREATKEADISNIALLRIRLLGRYDHAEVSYGTHNDSFVSGTDGALIFDIPSDMCNKLGLDIQINYKRSTDI